MSERVSWQNLVLLIDRLSPGDTINPRPVYCHNRYPRRGNYDGTADDSSSSDEEPFPYEPPTYESLRETDAHLEQEMKDPNVATRVSRNTLTLADLERSPDAWDIKITRTSRLPYCCTERDVADLDLLDGDFTTVRIDGINEDAERYLGTTWEGRAKESVLFIEHITREGYGPHASELGIMAYERVAPLPTLKTILVANVMNK